jgi:hypothetical protein
MSEFPRVRNPLAGRPSPPRQPPDLTPRGAGNPHDEEAGRKIMTYEEMMAAQLRAIGQ